MLFMVIERFKGGDATLVGERFRQSGRMLPEGVAYHASWMDSAGTQCFQIMEAAHQEIMAGVYLKFQDLYKEIEQSRDPSKVLEAFLGELPRAQKPQSDFLNCKILNRRGRRKSRGERGEPV
jgi:hypothetical protein